MGQLFRTHNNPLKNQKPLHFSSKAWRSMYLIIHRPMFIFAEKKIWARGSSIPVTYIGQEVLVHTGKKFKQRYVNRWMVGFKFGEFTWNRKYARYKSKRKKKNKGKK